MVNDSSQQPMQQGPQMAPAPRLESLPAWVAGLTLAILAAVLLPAPSGAEGLAADSIYFPPPESQGGWRALVAPNVDATQAQKDDIWNLTGVDWDQLKAAHLFMRSRYSGPDAFLIIRNGYVVGEWGSNSRFQIASCTKSLTSLAMAKLLDLSDDGFGPRPIGLEDFAFEFLPASWGNEDPARRLIKIKHLLSMSSGLELHDAPTTTPGYLDTVLTRPSETPPETEWAYSSASVDLLSVILQDLTGMSLKSFFNTYVASEIGVPTFPWGSMGAYSTGSAYADLSARELARVAHLTMEDGRWDSGEGIEQVISQERLQTQTQWVPFLDSTTFRIPNSFTNDTQSHLRYGYLWWTNRTDREQFVGAGVPLDAYYMAGYATQFAVSIPSLDMIVVRLASGPAPWSDSLMRGVLSRIVAAVSLFRDGLESGDLGAWTAASQ